jgi:hypothetical protein
VNITSGFTMDFLDSLETATFTNLTTVASGIHIYTMIGMEVLSFPSLQTAGSITLYVSWPHLLLW